jgi:O-antigen/teichoic acid export membrane protein
MIKLSSEYLKNIFTVFWGAIVSQIVPIALSPVLSRLYTPEDFGVYAFVISIGACAAAMCASQYNHGIMLEEKNNYAKAMVLLSIAITIAISLVSFTILWIAVWGLQIASLQHVKSCFILLPIYTIFVGLNSSFSYWNNRNKRYAIISKGRIISSATTIIIQIILAFMFTGASSFLLLGLTLGPLFSFIYLYLSTPSLRKKFFEGYSLKTLHQLGRKHKKFLLFTSLSDLLNTLLVQLPVFLLKGLVGEQKTGQFAFSNRLLSMPISFVSSSVGEVFKQRAVDEYTHTGTCSKIFIQTFKGLFFLSVIPFVLLFIFAPDIFAFVFGEMWREAGYFTRLMTPMFFFKFTVSPLTYIYYINGRQKEDLILHLLMLVFIVFSLYLGHTWLNSVNAMLLLYSLSFTGIYLYYFIRSCQLSKKELQKI